MISRNDCDDPRQSTAYVPEQAGYRLFYMVGVRMAGMSSLRLSNVGQLGERHRNF
jgi:hypothetical protein